MDGVRRVSFTIPGLPVAQERSRHRIAALGDGRQFVKQYDPAKSRNWKATVRDFAARAMAGVAPFTGPVLLEAVFVYLPLKGWPKRKVALLQSGVEIPKATKPDLKNLVTGIEDAITTIVFRDDGQVCSYERSRKVFGLQAEVRVTVTERS